MWLNKSKWIKKIPESPHQVLAIINEANKLYEEYKTANKSLKDEAENSYLKQGVVVNAIVKVKTTDKSKAFYNKEMCVTNVQGRNVRCHIIGGEKGNGWILKGYEFEVCENEQDI